MAISALAFLGFLEIGVKLEQPFGYGASDVDQDKYAAKIAKSIAEVTAVSIITARAWERSTC